MTRAELVQATLLALTRQNVTRWGGEGYLYTSEFVVRPQTYYSSVTLYMTQSAPGAVTIDWGDGSAPVSPDTSGSITPHHVYQVLDTEYTIRVTCKEGESWTIESNAYYGFLYTGGKIILVKASIRRGVTSIAIGAFRNYNDKFTSLELMDALDLTSIGIEAFKDSSITGSLILPSGITSIGYKAFENCPGLTGRLVLPNGITSIGINTFSACEFSGSLVIPDGVTSIGNYAFSEGKYTHAEMSNALTSIGVGAFYGCRELDSIEIHENVTSIGNGAFQDCGNLSSLICEALAPPTIGSSTLYTGTSTTVFVPAASVNAYKAAQYWQSWGADIQPIPTN